jgi:hypothetical protein
VQGGAVADAGARMGQPRRQGGHERLAERAGACAGSACAADQNRAQVLAALEQMARASNGARASGAAAVAWQRASKRRADVATVCRARGAVARRLSVDLHGGSNGATREG